MAPTPSSAQVDAMREWLRANTTAASIDSYSRVGIEWLIGVHYRPGGVEQFLTNHKEQG